MRLFNNVEEAEFVSRPNRFVVRCRLGQRVISAYLPNPGRLTELFLPGAMLLLEKSSNKERKFPYTVVAVLLDGYPVLLHTHRTNDVAEFLLERGRVPGLEGARIIRREKTIGQSRFDFLIEDHGREIVLEVKSCTLFTKRAAMFPDAVTARGRRHVEELAAISRNGRKGQVLFIINHPSIEYFVPDFHTDPAFAKALLGARDSIAITPLAMSVDHAFRVKKETRVLPIAWDVVEGHNRDAGAYVLVLHLARRRNLRTGALGNVDFPAGFYTYVGSARRGLGKRMERHRKREKKIFWHIDYLREAAKFVCVLPIRTVDDIECELAGKTAELLGKGVRDFGSSDCHCASHLFFSDKNPMDIRGFHDMIYYYRADRFF
jgi:sugar fermentation stimulation protein A